MHNPPFPTRKDALANIELAILRLSQASDRLIRLGGIPKDDRVIKRLKNISFGLTREHARLKKRDDIVE